MMPIQSGGSPSHHSSERAEQRHLALRAVYRRACDLAVRRHERCAPVGRLKWGWQFLEGLIVMRHRVRVTWPLLLLAALAAVAGYAADTGQAPARIGLIHPQSPSTASGGISAFWN